MSLAFLNVSYDNNHAEPTPHVPLLAGRLARHGTRVTVDDERLQLAETWNNLPYSGGAIRYRHHDAVFHRLRLPPLQ